MTAVIVGLLLPYLALGCGKNESKSCWSVCLIPRLDGSCAQEARDCKCTPNFPLPDVVNDAHRSVQRLGQDTLTTVQKAGGDTVRTLETGGGDTIRTVVKAGDDSVKTVVKAGNDASATYVKSWKDLGEQTKRSFDDAVEAGQAVANYSANQLKAQQAAVENAGKRIREGKVVDAMWGMGTEPLQSTEANFAKATQESKVVAAAAATAAATYGGPAGAAAYAAWSTYKATGDADMALRAGLLAAATAQSGASVAGMPQGTTVEVLKKAAMAGAAGGIAVAASGGDEQAIKEGFLKSGGAVLVQYSRNTAEAYSPEARDAWDTVQCLSARDIDCLSGTAWARDAKGKILYESNGKPRLNTSKLEGAWTSLNPSSEDGIRNEFITEISKLPNSKVIPLLNNKWALTWTIGDAPTIKHGEPTVVLTYTGKNPPFISRVTYGAAKIQKNTYMAYSCTAGGMSRTVKVKTKKNSCLAIYSRADGGRQVVWESNQYPRICAQKAKEFVQVLRSKGIACKVQ